MNSFSLSETLLIIIIKLRQKNVPKDHGRRLTQARAQVRELLKCQEKKTDFSLDEEMKLRRSTHRDIRVNNTKQLSGC